MHRTQLELEPGLVLDARRALWLAAERTLVVADLHLGYAWTHRLAGQLMPFGADDTLARLDALVSDFAPAELVLLGDVLHGAPAGEALADLRRLVDDIGARTRLRFVEGNHDFALAEALRRLGWRGELERGFSLGAHWFTHGHLPDDAEASAQLCAAAERGGRVIFGHEHPAVQLSDGVASSARCPCFVVAAHALVLPCFTHWSSGSNVERGWLSPLAKALQQQRRVVVVAGRLLDFG